MLFIHLDQVNCKAIFFLALFLSSLVLTAQRIPPAAPVPPPPSPMPQGMSSDIPMDKSVRIGTLPNGMRYYIKVNTKPEQRAELRLALKAGSMQEDEDQLGLAHFIEHMAFNGTRNFSKNELVNYLEKVGTRFGPDLNAYTSFDETVYMLQVRTDDEEQFSKGMLILRDWADGVAFDEEEIDKERGVVISEWRSRLSPQQRMQQEYFPILYYNSRYAKRLPIGEPDIINHAPYDVFRRFYNDWYRPELMALFVVGQVDPDQMEQQIREQFGSIRPATVARKKESDNVPLHEETFVRVITDPEATNATVQIMHKHRFTPVRTIIDYRQRLVESLYNRMLGRRLSDIAKGSDPPFVFGYTMFGQDVGNMAAYTSYASASSVDVRKAFETLLEENQRVLQHGFTDAELEREKANIMRQAEQSVAEEAKLESSRVVQRLIYHFLEENPIPDALQHQEMYASMMPTITRDEVSRLAKGWMTDRSRVMIITAPEKDKMILPDSAELIALVQEVGSRILAPYEDTDVSAPLVTGTFTAQPVLDYRHDSQLDLYHWTFANGVKVTAKPTDFKNDEILMNAYSQGGHSLYADDQYPSARSASSVVSSSGVGVFNAAALEKKLTGQRVSVSPFISERYEGINGSSSVQDIETLMQLTYGYITAFREDTVALSSFLKRERTRTQNMLANPQNWYFDKVNRIISQNHPRRGFPTYESYGQVRMQDITDIYQDRFKDVSDMHFYFVGNFQPEDLKELTSRYLAALPGGGRKEMSQDVGDRYPPGKVDSTFHRGAAPKSQVQLFFHGEATYHLDSAYVLQSLIELARIKLREELREEKGGVYGVSVSGGLSQYPIPQYSIGISFNADPPVTEELLESTFNVIEALKEEIDPEDIVKVTETQRQGRIKDLKINQYWMNAMVSSWINGTDIYDLTQPDRLEQRIAKLDATVLLRAARRFFQDRELIRIVMYPEKT